MRLFLEWRSIPVPRPEFLTWAHRKREATKA